MKPRPRFIADAMLGRLARWLRLMGYDTVYESDISDEVLIRRSRRERRICLTRDEEVVLSKPYRGLFIRSDQILGQLRQLQRDLKLSRSPSRFYTRCSLCNGVLARRRRESLKGKVPPYVYRTRRAFHHCPGCRKIYWHGSHERFFRDHLQG